MKNLNDTSAMHHEFRADEAKIAERLAMSEAELAARFTGRLPSANPTAFFQAMNESAHRRVERKRLKANKTQRVTIVNK